MPIIYIDILFFTNAVLDLLLLMMTAGLSGRHKKFRRLLPGGIFGGIYGSVIFFAEFEWLSWGIFSFLASAVMVTITFGFCKSAEFIRLMLTFYLSAFLLSGALSGLSMLGANPGIISNGVYYFPISTLSLILSAGALSVILSKVWKASKNRLLSRGKYCTVSITYQNSHLNLEGFFDSGCSVTDPYSDNPVIIIDPELATKLFKNQSIAFRMIPYKTINASGFMKGFSPDKCKIKTEENEFICDCTIAVSPAFSGGKAIINPEILKNRRTENDLQIFD